MSSSVWAAILAGGTGRRLGGVEKGLIKIGGREIISIILESLKDFQTVIVCRDSNQAELYSVYGDVITDIFKEMGPLAGIHSALEHLGERLVIVSTDMPFVSPDICRFLYEESVDCSAAVPVWSDGKFEPTLAAYTPEIRVNIEKCLRRGEKKVICAFKGVEKVKYIPVEVLRKFDPELISFTNINTPSDLKKAEKIINSM
jgi:molybdopterin-guanine dinucleotide biosynthesis protein A